MKVISPLPNNQDLACYFVTKHSWKGKYKRIFSIGSQGITTYNPTTLEVTNRWPYSDILEVKFLPHQPDFFTLFFVKENSAKKDGMKFSSEHRSRLMGDVLRQKYLATGENILKVDAFKHHWSEARVPLTLAVTTHSLDQLSVAAPGDNSHTATTLGSYPFNMIQALHSVTDVENGLVIVSKPFGRMHLFISSRRDQLVQKMCENAAQYCAVPLELSPQPLSFSDFLEKKFGDYGEDRHITSLAEFPVLKFSPKTSPKQSRLAGVSPESSSRRLLCLSETCLVERDPASYNIVTLKPLREVFAVVRDDADSQLFTLEYMNTSCSKYSVPQRDALLATLLDAVRSAGNRDVSVKMRATQFGYRWGPASEPVEEEVESLHLKFLYQAPRDRKYEEVIDRFNANIPYSGLNHSVTADGIFAENKEKLILAALQSVLAREGDQSESTLTASELEAQFHTLRRLVASRVGYAAFTAMPSFRDAVGLKVVKALNRESEAISHASLDMLAGLMHPMHEESSDLRQEQLNKSCLLSNHKFLDALLCLWIRHLGLGTGALVVSAMLDFLTFALCVPYSETTESKHFDALLLLVAQRGRPLFQHFQHPSLSIIKGAGLIMRALIEEGDAETARRLQHLALCEAALPRHLLAALYSGSDGSDRVQRQLSRHLIGLWVTNNEAAHSLLGRMLPLGLLQFLESEEEVPADAVEAEVEVRDNLKLALDHASRNQRNPHLVKIERHIKTLEKSLESTLQHWSSRLGLDQQQQRSTPLAPHPRAATGLNNNTGGSGSSGSGVAPSAATKERPIVLRKRRERVKASANWPLFYYKFGQNHSLPSLIWNHKTREELREGLEKELRAFYSDRDNLGNTLISWNHHEFTVTYASLQDELCIDGYYLRILLESSTQDLNIKSPLTFFNNLYHRFLLTTRIDMKCQCLQAMSIVYSQYSEVIGLFPDIRCIILMLTRTQDKLERDRLLIFLDKLLSYRENIKIFLDENGISVLVDFLSLCHLHVSRSRHVTQSNVLESAPAPPPPSGDPNSPEGEGDGGDAGEKEWYYGTSSEDSRGPVTFGNVRKLWSAGSLTPKTKVWAHGMEAWQSLHQVPQLKWTLVAKNSGGGVMNESELACLILDMLTKVCRCYPTRDEDDAIIWPLPKVKRALSHSAVLPHIVQTLLTFDPGLVERVATLLCEIVVDNALARKLYLTGVFFFILMYTGSNVLPIARFLQLTHTQQAFISDEASSSDLLKRSILGPLLPEAMLYYLENHGAEKFAQIFLGEFDTPEAIWSAEMRRHLIGKIAAHIADFTPRLRGNNRAVYQFCGIPAVRYPQLEREMFVNVFYLRHLTDSVRFPDWPINHPIQLLRDVLEAWKAEVERKPPEMSVDEAYESLGLIRGSHHEENVVRKAYYKIASQYHPDKNPGGRDIFVRANKAYDFLCSRTCWENSDPNPNNIVLVLRTQSILFHRYSEELSGYKYAGYRQLISTIRAETADENEALFGHGGAATESLLAAALELAYRTVQCSALNAQELNAEGGFQTLHVAFSRCMSVLSNSLKGNEMPVQVCSYVVKCYTVAAQFTACRSTFVAMCPTLTRDLAFVMTMSRLRRLACSTAQCLASLAIDESLRAAMLNTSAAWSLLRALFAYDYTLAECEVERSQEQNEQEMVNTLAKLCVKALSRLAGTPEAPSPAMALLCSLLTPYLARELVNDNAEHLLKLLTSNVRTPALLWNNTTRAQLMEILDANLAAKSTACVQLSVQYASHASELVVGGIFVRVYNEMPSFAIEDPKAFVLDLLTYLKKCGDPALCDSSTLEDMASVLTALNNVIINNTGLELQCIGHASVFFPLLLCAPLHAPTLRLLATIVRAQEVIADLSSTPGLLSHLLLTLHTLSADSSSSENLDLLLHALMSLVSHASLVKEMLARGGYLFLLDLLANSPQHSMRVRGAELLARLCNDKLSGPRVKLALDHFLPSTLTDSLRESPASSIALFDSEQENPELLWNQNQRAQLKSNVRVMCQQLYQTLRAAPLAPTTPLPPPPPVLNTREIVVGGVYLRLFALNTGWNLRRPKQFLSGLLDEALRVMAASPLDTQLLDLVSKCLLGLLQAQPNLIDLVPALGHIPRLVCQLSSSPLPVSKSILATLHVLSLSEACVGSMSQVDCIAPIKYVLTSHQSLLSLTAETLARIFAAKKDKIVKQAIDADLIGCLLGLLGGGGGGPGGLTGADNAATVRAHIVKALKSMAQSAAYGGLVNASLDQSSVWAAYKSQNHDLFIGSSQSNAYLTGVPASAGYLTQGATPAMPSSPPPLLPKPPHLGGAPRGPPPPTPQDLPS